MRRGVSWVLALVVGLGVAVWGGSLPPRAAACVRVPPEAYVVDPNQRAVDQTPPAPFSGVTGVTWRSLADSCNGQRCTHSSCGDFAVIELHFVPPRDEPDAEHELGYRLVWQNGNAPELAFGPADWIRRLPAGQSIFLEISHADLDRLDVDLALVAVDRAGNESVPSKPVHVEDSGCVRSLSATACDPSTQPAACSVSRVAASEAATWLLLPLGAVAWVARRRRARAGRSALRQLG